MTRDEIVSLIREVASEVGIDGDLLVAICTVESSLEPLAIRFEPAFRWTFEPRAWASKIGAEIPGYSVETETMLQSCSYGLAQIMGSVMREAGFKGTLQTVIVEPRVPLTYGARHLKKYLQKYGEEEKAVAAYNAGSVRLTPGKNYVNQRYVDKVYSELRKIRRLIL